MNERHEGLLLRANRAFAGRRIDDAVAKVRAIVGAILILFVWHRVHQPA
jgi:hypothetical protein